jgi:hypothetical protein
LKTYLGEKIIPEGVMHVNVQYNNQSANLDLYVVQKGGPPLFGREWLHHFHLTSNLCNFGFDFSYSSATLTIFEFDDSVSWEIFKDFISFQFN